MNKCKVIKKNGLEQILIKSEKGQQLDIAKVYSINNGAIPGLLRIDVEQKKFSFKLTYDISGFLTLQNYLEAPLNKATFAQLLSSILKTLQSMQTQHFSQGCLLMDFDKVLVIPSTQEICFAYVPIQGYESGGVLREFLLNIIQFGSFDPGENNGYIKEYIRILNSGINFSVFELEQFLDRLGDKKSAEAERVCPRCNNRVTLGSRFCNICGCNLTGEKRIGADVYDPWDSDGYTHDDERDSKKESGNTRDIGDETRVLVEEVDAGGTTVLGSGSLYQPTFPYLIRKKNEEKIVIEKPVFRLGKEKQYCDYFISDNTTVSRSHADIITRGDRYFILDQKSTNGTFIDGRSIPYKQEVELFSGTEIRLSNEEFTFYIEGAQ